MVIILSIANDARKALGVSFEFPLVESQACYLAIKLKAKHKHGSDSGTGFP